jgi:uncharacterized protein (TIGR03435 family)
MPRLHAPLLIAAALAAAVGIAPGQSAAPAAEFAAASVKPAASGIRGYTLQPLPGGVHAVNCTLKQLVAEAYHVYDFEVSGGPKWVDTDHFDIEAKTASGAKATSSDLRTMLQALLTQRFHLVTHTENKGLPVFAVETGKGGIKFEPSKESTDPPYFRVYQRRQITAERAPIEYLTEALSQLLGRRVVDETGLQGKFDYKLQWMPDEFQPANSESAPSAETDTPSLAAALREQMGLAIVAKREQAAVVVIDRASKPEAN